MPLRLSFLTIYNARCVYTVSMFLTVLIHFKLVRHVRAMSKTIYEQQNHIYNHVPI